MPLLLKVDILTEYITLRYLCHFVYRVECYRSRKKTVLHQKKDEIITDFPKRILSFIYT